MVQVLSYLTSVNIVFLAFIFLALLYFFLNIVGAVDSDLDIDDSSGEDFGHDAHPEADSDADGEWDDHFSVMGAASSLLNTKKRAPVTLALALLLLIWGICGVIINAFFIPDIFGVRFIGFLVNFIVSGFIGVMAVRRIAPLFARFLPHTQLEEDDQSIVGNIGKVSTILRPGKTGTVTVDIGKGVINVMAYLDDNEQEMKAGEKVLIYAYQKDKNAYLCSPVANDPDLSKIVI